MCLDPGAQSTLATHVRKICALKRLRELGGLAKEHSAIKHEVWMLRKGPEVEREGDEEDTRSFVTVTASDDGVVRQERGSVLRQRMWRSTVSTMSYFGFSRHVHNIMNFAPLHP